MASFPTELATGEVASPVQTESPAGRRLAVISNAASSVSETPNSTAELSAFDPLPIADDVWDGEHQLYHVVTVRVAGRLIDCDAEDQPVRRGDIVTIEGQHGPTLAEVVAPARRAMQRTRLPRVVRRSSEDDVRREASARRREQEIFRAARRIVSELDLPLKVVRASLVHGANRAIVYFASDVRFDFRELVKRLSTAAQTRVELRQIGYRDASAMLGGVGPCGLQLCCNTFLKDFAPVSIKMAKDQGLALTPQRVSGVCGRLLCCLVYEEAFYRQERARYPKINKQVSTPRGVGKVRDVDVLAQTIRVVLESGEHETFSPADIAPLFPSMPPSRT